MSTLSYICTWTCHLQASRLNFTTQRNLLVLDLVQFDRREGTHDLADDVIARISVEAENHKMQRHWLEFGHRQPVEGEVFFVDGISRVADDAVIESEGNQRRSAEHKISKKKSEMEVETSRARFHVRIWTCSLTLKVPRLQAVFRGRSQYNFMIRLVSMQAAIHFLRALS